VKVQNVERVFKDEFGNIDVTIDIIIKKDIHNDMEYQMLFVHLVTNEPNEKLVEYNKTIESGEEVWFWYTKKYYFKTRKVLNKQRMMTNTDMEEIKKGLKAIKLEKDDSDKDDSDTDSESTKSDA